MFGFIVLLSAETYGQDQEANDKKATRKEEKERKVREGRTMFTPLAGPAYTPELGGVIAATAMISYKTNRFDSLIQRSSSPITFGASTTGAVFFSNINTTFWLKDKLRIYSDFWGKDMPDNYWGVGYDDATNVEQGDSTTAYTRSWLWFNPRFLYQFKKYNFVGLNIDLNYTSASDVNPVMEADETYQRYKDKPFNSGLGLIFQYDSRDVPVNAWEGYYLNMSYTLFRDLFGSQNNYDIFLIDFRTYQNIGKRKGSTLALQLKTRLGRGDVPWGDMSQLGTPFDLRGYYWGRYRDESLVFGIVEYRRTFMKSDGQLSKSGMVWWVGTGSIGEAPEDFRNWVPNAGIGYRFEVQPRMNLRIDIGVGRESAGFYFNFNEAF